MRKAEALKICGGTQVTCAKALDISQAAVSKWPDIIPPLRAYQVREYQKKQQNKKKKTGQRKKSVA